MFYKRTRVLSANPCPFSTSSKISSSVLLLGLKTKDKKTHIFLSFFKSFFLDILIIFFTFTCWVKVDRTNVENKRMMCWNVGVGPTRLQSWVGPVSRPYCARINIFIVFFLSVFGISPIPVVIIVVMHFHVSIKYQGVSSPPLWG